MPKFSRIAAGLLEELLAIRRELEEALPHLDGEGKAGVEHACQRLADLSGNFTLLAGQLNLAALLKVIRGRLRPQRKP